MAALWRFPVYSLTIYSYFRVFCLILFTLGCSGLRVQQGCLTYNRKTVVFMSLSACWYVGSLILCVNVKFQDPQVKSLDSLIKSIIYLEVGMSIFMYVTTVCSMLSNMELTIKMYARIQHLDDIILEKFSYVFNYNKLLRKRILILLLIIAIYLTVILAVVSQASHPQEFLLHLWASVAYTAVTGGPYLICYTQMCMAEVLSARFRLIRKLLTEQAVYSSRCSTSQQEDFLRTLIYLVQEYHNCIRQVNQVFTVCLTSSLLHDFTLTTSVFYLNLGSSSTHMKNSMIWLVSIILPLHKMTTAPVYCEKSIREGEECFKIIIETERWIPRNSHVHVMVSSCMLWRMNNKIQFLCGTMNFNKRIVVVVYSQIFSYLSILLQFRMTEEIGNQIEK